jgi:hypothetical protein
MNRFIGLDGHSSSCTFAVLDEKGKTIRTEVVETNGQSLVEFLLLIPGRRHLCLEEGTQSQWLFELLAPHAHAIAVVRGEKNRGNKNDELDAVALAERMRTGALGANIFKAPQTFTSVRDLARTYGMITGDVVRTKNRIKSFYRSRGLQPGAGNAVYSTERREEPLKQLRGGTRQAVQQLCRELDALEAIKDDTQQALVTEAHKHAITRILETAPGLGPVRVAQLLAIVVSPHRFRTSRQFWAYCGLAIVMRSSSDWIQQPNNQWMKAPVTRTRGLNRNFNRTAKAIFKGAATTVITQMPKNPLYTDYRRLLEEKLKPNLAKLTIARRIAAITLAMWKNKEAYDPAKYQKKTA